MELRQLRYFATLAEHLHFGQAAETLGLAQSALSMQLQTLEKELGVKLVNRTKRSVALTEAGKLFLVEARATLVQAEQAQWVAKQAGRGVIGSLELGYVVSASCAGVVQTLLAQYHAAFPGVQIKLRELDSPAQAQLLAEGKLDCCVVRSAVSDTLAYEQVTLLREPVIVALAATHPLAKKKTLQAAQLQNEPFIVPPFYDQQGFAKHVWALAKQGGFVPKAMHAAADFITALTLVGAGVGVAVVPESLRVLNLPGVVYKELQDVQEMTQLYFLYRRHETSPFVLTLVDTIHQQRAKNKKKE